MSDCDPSIPELGRCVATEGSHRCDLTDRHLTGVSHQCCCGVLFGTDGQGGVPADPSRSPALEEPAVDRSSLALATELSIPREWKGGGVILEPAAPEQGPPCSKCGEPMPPLPPELASVARKLGTGVVLAHEVCPTEKREPEGRYFEVRVQVVEVTEQPDQRGEMIPNAMEMITFVAGHRAPDLDAAMRPLALALGEKWALAEKQAAVADS